MTFDTLSVSDEAVIVAFGDSTTAPREGVTAYPERLQQHWRAHGRPVMVVNAGVAGDNTDGALARMALDVLAHAPQVVIVRFGINDAAMDVWEVPPSITPRVPLARFQRNLRDILARIRAIGAVPLLCTPNPLAWHELNLPLYGRSPYQPDNADGFNVMLRQYVAAIQSMASEADVPLVDLDAAFRAHQSDLVPQWSALLLDGMHPNDAGHRLAASLLVPAVEALL